MIQHDTTWYKKIQKYCSSRRITVPTNDKIAEHVPLTCTSKWKNSLWNTDAFLSLHQILQERISTDLVLSPKLSRCFSDYNIQSERFHRRGLAIPSLGTINSPSRELLLANSELRKYYLERVAIVANPCSIGEKNSRSREPEVPETVGRYASFCDALLSLGSARFCGNRRITRFY